jgi:hypothetical protein
MNDSDREYLNKSGIDSGRVARRYIWTLRKIHQFINTKKIAQNVTVDGNILKTAIFDYFVDIARIKDFHKIEHINTDKIYSYMAYWLLKRKPIQIKIPFPEYEFINELFVTAFLISNICFDKNISCNKIAQNATFKNFQSLLYYHLKYRSITQQSLELMIEAFFCGCDFK